MVDRKPRFILIDPSFDGARGDKWQYAVAFARSALASGFDFHLVSNEASPSISDELSGIREHRLFRYAFYEHEKIVMRHDRSPAHLLERGQAARWTRRIARAEREVGDAWNRNDRGRVELEERRLRLFKRDAARQASASEVREALLEVLPFNRDDYADALATMLADLKLEKGDRLFFHTVTPAMMESLTEVTLRLNLVKPVDVDAYFLFHFGAAASDARTFLDRYHSYSHFGSMISRLRSGSPFQRQFYLTTCPELSEECEALFGVPFGRFDGLVNLDAVFRALGGEENEIRLRQERQGTALAARAMRVVVRASDLNPDSLAAVKSSLDFFKSRGEPLSLRVLYHGGSAPMLRDIAAVIGDDVHFIDTESNEEYIRALAESDVMLLTYRADHYEKRVSAVLHDCSVMGVACVVPDATTLATADDYADISVYSRLEELPGILLRVWRSRADERGVELRAEKVRKARELYATDVVTRLLSALPAPSLAVDTIGPKAVVVMPAWGRCGSSFAMEAQVRYLLNAGYFVVQLFVLDKAENLRAATSYFWSILEQNSKFTRGSIQRVVCAKPEDIEALEETPEYLASSPFEQHLMRIAAAEIHDPDVEAFCRDAQCTVVNHVFHSRFAHRWCGGSMILETHDIQSYQMAKWPLRNAATDEPAGLSSLLRDEMAEVSRFDHVINVAPEEHSVLSLSAKASSLIIPYVPDQKIDASVLTVEQMAIRDGWGEWYRDIERMPLLLVGDSHVANREAGEWFLSEVYKPYLQPKGIVLSIAGKLSTALFERFENEPSIMFTGYVKDLSTLRALSEVCVLPDRRGTGISIKTLETFAESGAFVATTVALRGLGKAADNLPRFDDPKAFAEEIIRLLGDLGARQLSGEQAREVYEHVAGPEKFQQQWDAILSGEGKARGKAYHAA